MCSSMLVLRTYGSIGRRRQRTCGIYTIVALLLNLKVGGKGSFVQYKSEKAIFTWPLSAELEVTFIQLIILAVEITIM